ncbi:hypothetical protein Tco_0814821 [Tanacetum coccineum]
MEVEPLDHTKLEDLGLNTCSHDLFLSSRENPSVDEPKPQLLPKISPLDGNLEDKRGTDPPINLDINLEGLLGQSGSLGVDFFKLEMIEDDLKLEFKDVSFLGRGLNLPVRPKEVEKVRIKDSHHLEHIFQQVLQHMAPLHHNSVYRYYHPHLPLSVEEPSPLSVK